jgi:hypothetical protein
MKKKFEEFWDMLVTIILIIPAFWKWFFTQVKNGALFK